jgi:hypothetical protein
VACFVCSNWITPCTEALIGYLLAVVFFVLCSFLAFFYKVRVDSDSERHLYRKKPWACYIERGKLLAEVPHADPDLSRAPIGLVVFYCSRLE